MTDEGEVVAILDDVPLSTGKTDDVVVLRTKDNKYSFVEGACFTAETPVQTSHSFTPIAQLAVGDTVVSYNEPTGQGTLSRISRTFSRSVNQLIRLVTNQQDTLYTTHEHPFMTEAGWKPARQLMAGTRLRLIGGAFATLLSVQAVDSTATVYNVEVEREHTYTVGHSSMVVHNSCDALAPFRTLLNEEDFTLFVRDFAANPAMLSRMENNQGMVEAWRILRNSYTNPSSAPDLLFRNMDALEALARIRTNPKLAELGLTDNILATIRGYGTGTSTASYAELINDLNSLGNFLHANPGTRLENFGQTIKILVGDNSNYKQGVHWMIRDVAVDARTLGGKTIRFEHTVKNARGTTSYIDVFCPNCAVPNLKIEYKSGPNSITSATIKEQFIERDLFNAGSLDEIQWRMTNTGMTKEKLVGWLEENKEALKGIDPDRANSLLNRMDLRGVTELQKDKIANTFIDYFKNDINYNKIFK